MNNAVIFFGAESDIAKSTMKNFFDDGYFMVFVARCFKNKKWFVENFTNNVCFIEEDFLSDDLVFKLKEALIANDLKISNIIISYGVLGNNSLDSKNIDSIINTNYVSKIKLFKSMLENFNLDNCHITLFGSVAGDRGRGSNMIYGSSIAGIQVFFQGLVNYNKTKSLKFLIIKLGPVNTKMTKNIENKFLSVETSYVSNKIYKLIHKKKYGIRYIPFYWKYIMFIISNLPYSVFKKTSL